MNQELLRLIEDCLPLDIISDRAAREKAQRSGHLTSIHLWWGRKPQISARAAVYAALVPAPRDDKQRLAYLQQLTDLCHPKISTKTLKLVQRQITEIHAERNYANKDPVNDTPLIVDLFAGGGSIPLEALRLGCTTLASDLNPVAYIIELCTLVYPQRYSELAAQVAHWGKRLLDQTQAAVSDCFPPITDHFDGMNEITPLPLHGPDQAATTRAGVIPSTYLWTRTIPCPNPHCGAIVPLPQNTWLVNKTNRVQALRMVPNETRQGVMFEHVTATSRTDFDFNPDNTSSRGHTRCVCCGASVDSVYVKQQGLAGQMGVQLMAVVCRDPVQRRRHYVAAADLPATLIPSDQYLITRITQLCAESGLTLPDEPIFSGDSRAFFTHLYGLNRFDHLFTHRQLLLLLTSVQQIHQLHQHMLDDGMDAAMARAVTTYLGLLISRLADWNSTICNWSSKSESISNTFARPVLPMKWNFAEIYPFDKGSGNLPDALDRMVETITILSQMPSSAHVTRGPAHRCNLPDSSVDAVITDPPYYDNVPYADLSDFFYVWLKRSIGYLYPEHFTSFLTPKKQEAYVSAARHQGDYDTAVTFYQSIIQQSLEEAHRILKPAAPLVLVYAHKTTAGWASIVDALRSAQFMVTEAWPISTEARGRMRAQNAAALASSIFIVARKRTTTDVGIYARDVLPELTKIVQERVRILSHAGITGADLVIATVGAGLRAYTRFARVEEDNGDELEASNFLTKVQQAALVTILADVVGLDQSGMSAVDTISQYYVLARYQYGLADIEVDDALVLARGMGVEFDGPRSLTSGMTPLVLKIKNKVRLQDYRQRGAANTLGRFDGMPAPLIDVLHRLLWLNDHQPTAIAAFLSEAQSDTTSLRLVAEALAGRQLTSEATSHEQQAIGRLLPVWHRIVVESHQERLL